MNVMAWLAAIVMLAVACGAPAMSATMPRPDVVLALRDGRFLHLAPLPFGTLSAAIVGAAAFDESGTRALLVATFPGAGVHADWRTANPAQAFLVDAQRRTLTQLTTAGHVTSARWSGQSSVLISQASQPVLSIDVGDAAGSALPRFRFEPGDVVPYGSSLVSPSSSDRVRVFKTPGGRYVVMQVGARRFRIAGVARTGVYAIIGGYLAWIDDRRHLAQQIARFGLDNAEPLSFAGSPYGDALVPIVPLGSHVYQAAYRNGVVYFTFSYGVERIVAASNDLVNYWFPNLPHEPLFTVGDGFGVSPDGAFYFIRPEEDLMLFTRAGHYVRMPIVGLDAARDEQPLIAAMRKLTHAAEGDPLRPEANALDSALLEWRFYPVGDAAGERWIASRLGRVLIGDRRGHFVPGVQPAFPFAVLGRTDDGRIWGAAPAFDAGQPGSELSSVWWSHDGATWHANSSIDGSIGAVATQHGSVWVACTHEWMGEPMIWIARLGDPTAEYSPTGATFAGEQLAFADLPNGFYLLWGATPGFRLDGGAGPLSAFRIDAAQLSQPGAPGTDAYVAQRLQPDSDPSLPAKHDLIADADALLDPTLALARTLRHDARLTLRTNVALRVVPAMVMTVMDPDQERAFELKYAGRPYPLATVLATVVGEGAIVSRSLEYGPLHATGSLERWTKIDGAWRLSATVSRYSY